MRTLTNAALAAQAIRKELKTAFPDTKFSIRSENYSMGNSVNVAWTDGPSIEAVEHYTNKYQKGHFDGMTDMYEYSNKRDDIPQTRYVITERSFSDEFTRKKAEYLRDHYDGLENTTTEDLTKCFSWRGQWWNYHQIVWKHYNNKSIINGNCEEVEE